MEGLTWTLSLFVALLFWKWSHLDWQSLWIERWGLLAFWIGGLLIWRLRWKTKWAPAFLTYLLLIATVSCYLSGFHGDRPMIGALDKSGILMAREASFGFLTALFLFIGFLTARPRISWIFPLLCLWVFLGMVFSSEPGLVVLLLKNPSMAATFVVLASGAHPLSIFAVAVSRSWTALGAWAVCALYRLRLRYPRLVAGVAASGAIFLVAGRIRIPDNGRFVFWQQTWDWWSQSNWLNILIGVGPGTCKIYIPLIDMIQSTNGQANVTIWAHNDWLQLLVEGGVIGLGLAITCAIKLFMLAKEKDRGLILAFGVAMVSNFPVHSALHALVGWALVSRVLLADEVVDEDCHLASV